MAARRKRKASGSSRTARRGTKPGKKTATKAKWGGRRAGAGRPVGTGTGPSPNSRRNRIAVMLSDKELRVLKSLARVKKLPVATGVYEMIKSKLRHKG